MCDTGAFAGSLQAAVVAEGWGAYKSVVRLLQASVKNRRLLAVKVLQRDVRRWLTATRAGKVKVGLRRNQRAGAGAPPSG